ncbi:partial Creatinine amidohydrolase, partial [Anaerolineales bacterium]
MIIETMTMVEFEEGLKRTQTIFIPFGSVEEHGSHLPLSTDTIQAYEVGKKAAQQIPLFVAPPIHYGSCRSTSCHPGTISITTGTLKALMKDIVRSLYAQGMRNIIVLTGHAGGSHRMALQDAGEELLPEIPDIRIAVVTEYELASREGK